MKLLQEFLFFDAVTSTGVSNVIYSPLGSELVLDVDSSSGATYTIKVQGYIDNNNITWRDLSTINVTTLAVANSISADGGYSISINGINHIRCEITALTGTLRVFGRVTE